MTEQQETTVTLPQAITCQRERCRWTWMPRVANPKLCPRCHKPWRKPLKDFRTRYVDKKETPQ